MIEDVEPTVPLGRRFWALTKDERGELQGLNRAGGDQPISWHQIVPSVSAYSMADPKFAERFLSMGSKRGVGRINWSAVEIERSACVIRRPPARSERTIG